MVESDVWMVAEAIALAGRLRVQVAYVHAHAIDAAVLATPAPRGALSSSAPIDARAFVLGQAPKKDGGRGRSQGRRQALVCGAPNRLLRGAPPANGFTEIGVQGWSLCRS
jgi:hypothetical protein